MVDRVYGIDLTCSIALLPKGRSVYEGMRLPMQHAIFPRLKDVIESPTDSIEW